MNTHWNTVSSNRHHKALSLFPSTAWFDCVSTQCSNGCPLGSLLFPRQDNLVQRCTTVSPNRWEEASERVFFCLFHHGWPTTWLWPRLIFVRIFFSFFFRCTKEPHKQNVTEQKSAERRETKEHAKKRWGGKNKRGENFQLTYCWSSASSSHGTLFDFSRRCFVSWRFVAQFTIHRGSPRLTGWAVTGILSSPRATMEYYPPDHSARISPAKVKRIVSVNALFIHKMYLFTGL